MPSKRFEEQLSALEQLRGSYAGPGAVDGLRKALGNRNNYIIAKAAAIAGELGLTALMSDMAAAFERFLAGGAKSDPQCWAKNALAKSLAGLGSENAQVFLRGARHVQMEPVWGGRQDTAGPLRGHCAQALVGCRGLSDHEVLGALVELLADKDKTVRVEAARAMGRVARPEAALLLRLKALVGDEEPEALGACFSGLLSIEGRAGIDFVARFLDGGEEAAGEAALALGLMRDTQAFELLRERWKRERDPSRSAALLSAIALSRLDESARFLIELIASDAPGAGDAIAALASAGISGDVRARAAEAAERSGNRRLCAEFRTHFAVAGAVPID